VVGDRRYGGLSVKGLGGHALHAFSVGFPHPANGQNIAVYAPLPPGLMSLLRQLTVGNFNEVLKDLSALEFMLELSAKEL